MAKKKATGSKGPTRSGTKPKTRKTPKGTDIDPVTGDRLLFESMDEVPERVSVLAGTYEKAVTAANKAKAKEKGAKASLLDTMLEEGIGRIPIRGGKEWIVVEDEHKVAIRKPKKEDDDDAVRNEGNEAEDAEDSA